MKKRFYLLTLLFCSLCSIGYAADPKLYFFNPIPQTTYYNKKCKTANKTPQLTNECKIFREYHNLRNAIGKLGYPIENIYWYRAIRFIDYRKLESIFEKPSLPSPSAAGGASAVPTPPPPPVNISNVLPKVLPWNIYDPKPKTWIYWEKGNFFRRELSDRIRTKSQWKLTFDELKDLHMKLLDEELQLQGGNTWTDFGTRTIQRAAKAVGVVPPPGELRNEKYTPTFKMQKIPLTKKAEYNQIKSELPTMKIVLEDNPDAQTFNATFTFTTGGKPVEFAINRFLHELSSGIQAIQSGQSKETPLHFSARMQRKYVSIHPFHEGNGRMSRMVQDLILDAFGLPFVPAGYLQEDLTTPLVEYYNETLRRTHELVELLKICSQQISTNMTPNPMCYPLYKGYKEYKNQTIATFSRGADNENRAIYSEIQASIMADLVTRGNPYRPQKHKFAQFVPINNAEELCKRDCSPFLGITNLHDETLKIKVIEKVADLTPLSNKLQLYTWVKGNNYSGRAQMNLANRNPSLFHKLFIGSRSEVYSLARMGKGIYGALTPFSSGQFALSSVDYKKYKDDNQNHKQAIKEIEENSQLSQTQKTQTIAALEKHRAELIHTNTTLGTIDAILYVIKIKDKQPVLDMTNIQTKNLLKGLGIKTNTGIRNSNNQTNDVGHLNPNIIAKYDAKKGWFVIKLNTANSFTIKQAEPDDISPKTKLAIQERLQKGDLKGGQKYLESLIKGTNLYQLQAQAIASEVASAAASTRNRTPSPNSSSAAAASPTHETVGSGSAELTFSRYKTLTKDCRCQGECTTSRFSKIGDTCWTKDECGREEFKAEWYKLSRGFYRKCHKDFEKQLTGGGGTKTKVRVLPTK